MPFIPKTVKSKAHENSKIQIDDPQAAALFSWNLARRIFREHGPFNNVVLLCIGTDRSTGDCLGPLVGSKFLQSKQSFFHVYGTLDEPVHACNLKDKIEFINKTHHNPLIIAIDACLGRLENVGCISIESGSLLPGAGVNKTLPPVGDINIAGIVNVGGFMEYIVLQNTRLNLVMKMADVIVEGLLKTIWELKKEQAPCL